MAQCYFPTYVVGSSPGTRNCSRGHRFAVADALVSRGEFQDAVKALVLGLPEQLLGHPPRCSGGSSRSGWQEP